MYTITTTTTAQPIAVINKGTEPVTGTTLVAAALGGTVTFAKVRESGSMRHWPVLAPGSVAHAKAAAWAQEVEDGTPIAEVAKKHNTSVPTIRRALTALAFTQEVASMPAAKLSAIAKGANANGAEGKKEEKPATKPAAKKATPAKKAPAKKATPAKATAKPSAKKAPAKRRPSAATMRAALVRNGATKEAAASLSPAALVEAFNAL